MDESFMVLKILKSWKIAQLWATTTTIFWIFSEELKVWAVGGIRYGRTLLELRIFILSTYFSL